MKDMKNNSASPFFVCGQFPEFLQTRPFFCQANAPKRASALRPPGRRGLVCLQFSRAQQDARLLDPAGKAPEHRGRGLMFSSFYFNHYDKRHATSDMRHKR